MEHPVKDVPGLVKALCTGTPEQQQLAVRNHFEKDASFKHPLCWVPSFADRHLPFGKDPIDSRTLILGIFKWYKMLSPKVTIEVQSAVFDQRTCLLYLTCQQKFSVWFIPTYSADVQLVTVLHLNQYTHAPDGTLVPARDNQSSAGEENDGSTRRKSVQFENTSVYKIKMQEDFYQINELVKFVTPGSMGAALCSMWQLFSTGLCMMGVLGFLGLTFVLDFVARIYRSIRQEKQGNKSDKADNKDKSDNKEKMDNKDKSDNKEKMDNKDDQDNKDKQEKGKQEKKKNDK